MPPDYRWHLARESDFWDSGTRAHGKEPQRCSRFSSSFPASSHGSARSPKVSGLCTIGAQGLGFKVPS